jgi:hypothetical protein
MSELRTRTAIDTEYTREAAQAGHKAGLVVELEEQLNKFQEEIKVHILRLGALRKEEVAPAVPVAAVLPPEAEKQA